MSMHLEFEPHSWYKGWAIQDTGRMDEPGKVYQIDAWRWHAYTDDGMTYRIIELKARTLKELKQQITEYRSK